MKTTEEIKQAQDTLKEFANLLCRDQGSPVIGACLPLPMMAIVYLDCLDWILQNTKENTFKETLKVVNKIIADAKQADDSILNADLIENV